MRKLLTIAGTVAMLIATGGRLEAASFTVAGTTSAAFDGAPLSDPATLGALTFWGTSFSVETIDLGGGDQYATADFGTFRLGTGPITDFVGRTFTLSIDFSAPSGASPDPSALTATLKGAIEADGSGGVTIKYLNSAFVTFDTGSFELSLDRVSLMAGQLKTQGGTIEGTSVAVPEPASMLLFGTGAVAVALARRRRAVMLPA